MEWYRGYDTYYTRTRKLYINARRKASEMSFCWSMKDFIRVIEGIL